MERSALDILMELGVIPDWLHDPESISRMPIDLEQISNDIFYSRPGNSPRQNPGGLGMFEIHGRIPDGITDHLDLIADLQGSIFDDSNPENFRYGDFPTTDDNMTRLRLKDMMSSLSTGLPDHPEGLPFDESMRDYDIQDLAYEGFRLDSSAKDIEERLRIIMEYLNESPLYRDGSATRKHELFKKRIDPRNFEEQIDYNKWVQNHI